MRIGEPPKEESDVPAYKASKVALLFPLATPQRAAERIGVGGDCTFVPRGMRAHFEEAPAEDEEGLCRGHLVCIRDKLPARQLDKQGLCHSSPDAF